MKLILSALLLSAGFLTTSAAIAKPAKKSTLEMAQSKCNPMKISGEKEKTICTLSLSVVLARSFQSFCKKGEVCIGQPSAFSDEVLGQTLYILERDLPKKGYELKISGAQLFRMIDSHLEANPDENSVAMVSIFLSPYVVAIK